jgi:hypothetical protein
MLNIVDKVELVLGKVLRSRPSANKRAKFQVGYLMHAHGEIR